MLRTRWFVASLAAATLAGSGCGLIPGLPDFSGNGGAVMVSPRDDYRGRSSLAMRFNMPQRSGYGVMAVSSDIERIDVALTDGVMDLPYYGRPEPMPPVMGEGGYAKEADGTVRILPMPPDAPTMPPPPDGAEPWPTKEIIEGPVTVPMPIAWDGGAQPLQDFAKPMTFPYKPAPEPVTAAQASISRDQLQRAKGNVVFNALKAGAYRIRLAAFDREGRVIGSSSEVVEIKEGQTTTVSTNLVLDGSGGTGGLGLDVNIVDGDVPTGSGNSGSVGHAVASSSTAILDYWTPERMKAARPALIVR